MIVKFFKNSGVGKSSGVMDYMLGRDRMREDVKILKGSEVITSAIIDQSLYARTYTSGCLSFSEKDLSLEVKKELMDSFEGTLMSGLDKSQYNILWIEHRDKGRLELNFIIPNVELTTGNRLQPYYSWADKPLVNAWKNIQNIERGFSDPNDPMNQQLLTKDSNLPRASAEAKLLITEALELKAIRGEVKNRDDVVNALTEFGFTVTRTTDQSISIANPEEGGRNIRLKGYLYERDFTTGEELQRTIEEASRRYGERTEDRYKESQRIFERGLRIKQEYNQGRYCRERRGAEVTIEQSIIDGSIGAGRWSVEGLSKGERESTKKNGLRDMEYPVYHSSSSDGSNVGRSIYFREKDQQSDWRYTRQQRDNSVQRDISNRTESENEKTLGISSQLQGRRRDVQLSENIEGSEGIQSKRWQSDDRIPVTQIENEREYEKRIIGGSSSKFGAEIHEYVPGVVERYQSYWEQLSERFRGIERKITERGNNAIEYSKASDGISEALSKCRTDTESIRKSSERTYESITQRTGEYEQANRATVAEIKSVEKEQNRSYGLSR